MTKPPKYYDQVVLSCRVDRDLYTALLRIAGERQQKSETAVTVSGLVRTALETFTQQEGRKK